MRNERRFCQNSRTARRSASPSANRRQSQLMTLESSSSEKIIPSNDSSIFDGKVEKTSKKKKFGRKLRNKLFNKNEKSQKTNAPGKSCKLVVKTYFSSQREKNKSRWLIFFSEGILGRKRQNTSKNKKKSQKEKLIQEFDVVNLTLITYQ